MHFFEISLLSFILLPATAVYASSIFHYNVLGGADFPDPSIINADGISYAFCTPNGDADTPMTHNSDFDNASDWSDITDAFPSNGVPAFGSSGWAVVGTAWAPDVNHLTDFDGSYAMYYSPALQSNDGIHCIGLARSTVVSGPYNDSSTQPMICPEADGGAIDAAGYLDRDNRRYIVYKIDGPAIANGSYCVSTDNPPSYNTSLMLQEVANDGYTTIGGPVVLYNNEGVADRYNIEAPMIVSSQEGSYFLFFNSGCYGDNSYTINYVTSTINVSGPYSERKVFLKTGDSGLFGPGGLDIDQKTGDAVFHSLKTNNTVDDGRVLNTARVKLAGRTALIE